MSKLGKRLLVAAILLLVLAAILHLGGWLQCAIFTIGAIASVFEISNAFEKKDHRPFMAPAYLYAAGYFVLYRTFGIEAVFLLGLFVVMLALMERILERTRTTEDAFYALIPLAYPLAFFTAVAMVAEYAGDYNRSRIALLSIFAMPLMGDTFAYTIGKLFGKRKLSPELSPNKTVAGGIGGVFGGAAGGALVYAFEGLYPAGVSLPLLLGLGLLCGVFGQFGDLFASAIKRWAGIKDYSRIFSEHGGMLDRLDSVLFCAPIVYAVFKIMGV